MFVDVSVYEYGYMDAICVGKSLVLCSTRSCIGVSNILVHIHTQMYIHTYVYILLSGPKSSLILVLFRIFKEAAEMPLFLCQLLCPICFCQNSRAVKKLVQRRLQNACSQQQLLILATILHNNKLINECVAKSGSMLAHLSNLLNREVFESLLTKYRWLTNIENVNCICFCKAATYIS